MPQKYYSGGYPVYGGFFGDRGSLQGYDQRMAAGAAGPWPGQYDPGGSLPPAAGPGTTGPPIQPGDPLYFGNPTPAPTSSPSPYPTSTPYPTATPTPQPTMGNPSITITGDQPGAMGAGTMPPTGNFNYYDAGNGITYVYDQNWNYVGTTSNNNAFQGATAGGSPGSGPQNQAPGQVPVSMPAPGVGPTSAPWYTAGPYAGGNQNPANPGYVAPGVGPQSVTGQSGGEGTGASFGFLMGHQTI